MIYFSNTLKKFHKSCHYTDKNYETCCDQSEVRTTKVEHFKIKRDFITFSSLPCGLLYQRYEMGRIPSFGNRRSLLSWPTLAKGQPQMLYYGLSIALISTNVRKIPNSGVLHDHIIWNTQSSLKQKIQTTHKVERTPEQQNGVRAS